MRTKLCLLTTVLFILMAAVAPGAYAQGGVKTGPDPATIRDPDLEKDSLHNLEVARNYFKLKKAYVAALARLEEIIAGNPNFAKIEEVYLMAGMSSLWLAEGKGKQKPDQYFTLEGGTKHTLTPQQFKEMGRGYLSKLVNEYPNGPFTKQAADELQALGGPLPKENP
ncbi:MAG TPA: outer membrane protein assembly factor BamD [Pyrinomonadaceae bacterium]|nr:outer membrane protein assembly factor BamD [Pyrinomonadaceae bacterium]